MPPTRRTGSVSHKNTTNSNQNVTESSFGSAPNCFLNAKYYFSEFCDNTSVHGFKFLGEAKRSLFEKLWWFIVIVVSLCCCTILIKQTYEKWISAPVIVSFATTQTPIRDIPFPGITICSDVKARRRTFNYTDVEIRKEDNETVSEADINKYNYMNMVCENKASLSDDSIRFADEEALDFIANVTPSVRDMIPEISWRGVPYENTELFLTPVLNSEGVCYTFNIMDRVDLFTDEVIHYKDFFSNGNSSSWTMEQGFKMNEAKDYPRSSVVSGFDGGIDFVLRTFTDNIDYRCSANYIGFKVTLQQPTLIPKGRKNFFSVPANQIVLASVKPTMIRTSPEIRNYTPDKRQCFFATEKHLRFYKTYNQHNCLMECLTNFTLQTCGCVAYYMPRDKSTHICGAGSRKCAEKVKVWYLLSNLDKNSTSQKSYSDTCNCLPSCTSLDFEVEVSQSDWDWERIYQVDQNVTGKINYSRLRVYFKDMQFITSVRNELYGTTDFLASCGGLLGLFMGFSAISLFEIIYFITLRFVCNVKNFGRYKWSGAETLFEIKVNT